MAPWSLALNPLLGLGSALAFLTFGAIRLRDAWAILRYRRNIRRLPRYAMTSRDVPVSQQRLFVGQGFRWEQRHTHRLMQTIGRSSAATSSRRRSTGRPAAGGAA